MSLHVALTHRTEYRYDRAVTLGPQTIRLRPAPHARTPVLAYSLTVEPKPHFLNWQQDPQGNFLARVVFPEKVASFAVTVDLVADMATINPFDFFLEPQAETWPFEYDPVLVNELAPYRRTDPVGPRLQAMLDEVPREQQRNVDKLVALNQMVLARTAYIVRMEPGVWTPEETLAAGRGSCRDSAWLLVQLLRNLGYAARFVSGYLIQLVGDVKPLEGPEGPTADFTDLHAWAEIYLPGAGWIGLDATSGLLTGEGHIPLAASPDPQSAAPISGAVEDSKAEFGFEMAVRRVLETPRVTKPYSETQWAAIQQVGEQVDAALAAGDVRLTLGGEPTFVASSDFEAGEWNTAALGPTKRRYAGRLLRRLAGTWSNDPVLHYGMGKQYPGEPLPRWALTAHWRTDGEPIWQNQELLADPDSGIGAATEADAAAFAIALAARLGVDPAMVQPAYEDALYYLWKEQRLPANVLAEDSKLRDRLERARLARLFTEGIGAAVGRVLPLRRVPHGEARAWQSARWQFRADTLFLLPGDSPIGLRLPLDSLAWADPATIDPPTPRDPFAAPQALPAHAALPSHARAPAAPAEAMALQIGKGDPGLVRTALTVEPRDGRLHIFLPPLDEAVDWLDLIAAIEATAAAARQPVVLEGYLPPDDPGIEHFSVTPDPGVIEVNLHPATNWADLVRRTEEMYDAARQIGLASEKFMVDGRHVGTGGGNHVVIGGAEPADSPFLRRPDLLKSLLGFWHNHPSLSFLFSGLFIGPTSQHPRIDEARDDATLELEIAFSQVSRDAPPPPWLTDRIFRNVLADMTGNTHRTEFCIDKMYDPSGPSGRRGLVEFRAFEMPPHPRMAAAQMLLVRAAVATFWRTPYERPLVRWGTRLHDEFLLPHYCEQDFNDAMQELGITGIPLHPAWFAPHLAFRFPVIGEIALRGLRLELRHALEPWHVLGEEQSSAGTVRYVDSSAERVQVRAEGWVAERYVLACNGVAIPLQATGRIGDYVSGIRFKAWNPPSALHPTIRPQVPLVFDVIDRWTGRALGGMTHHVAHPGGRSYEDFPVNANSAEARRRARFFPFGHSPAALPPQPVDPPAPDRGREHPRTLDLRRFA
jgi:uncharacterized protein (DUF2126 family)/transglutaminase-like putative cysteine protease